MILSGLWRIGFLIPVFSLFFLSASHAQPAGHYRQPSIPSDATWQHMFGDQLLDTLIRKAVDNNYNLLNALHNVELAKSKLRFQRSGFYPEFDVTASYSPEKNSLGIEHINERNHIGQAAINMSWEIDVFGSIRKSARSQEQFYYASQENYRAVMVSLTAQLSIAYIHLRTYQQQLEIARQNLASQQEILSLTESRYTVGLTSSLDVAQAKGLYLQTKALVPGMEAAVYSEVNLVCVLTGEYSAGLQESLRHPQKLPAIQAEYANPAADPQAIRRRPDVRAAEQTMDGLASAVGATRSDWWPKFYVNGSFGYGADQFRNFTKKENMDWQISPSVKWTIFSGRRLVENTKTAMLQLDEGINHYNHTMLTAIQEVDDALMSYRKSLLQLDADREALVQVKETLRLAVELYGKGLTGYQSVLDSQRNVFGFENTLVTSESRTLLCVIQLYQALTAGPEE